MVPRLFAWLADAGYASNDPERLELLRLLRERFPDSREAADVAGKLRQAEALGEPFELRFEDAVTGAAVDLAELRGKVVVLDFWATWCVPCVAALPDLVELYERYHADGLEIVGVSLDLPEETDGGLTKLLEFVAERKIPWPQYYVGDSGFADGWGVTSIPQLFVIDPQGKLHSTDAREELDTLVPQLLAR